MSRVEHSSQLNTQLSDQENSSQFKDEELIIQSFDSILSQVGFGPYQIGIFIIVGVIGMCDAGESQALSLVLPLLEDEWGISEFQESLMGSLVYAGINQFTQEKGYFIGSMASGFVADQYGRKYPIFYVSGAMFIVAILGAFMPNYALYTLFRVLLVTCVGFLIPVAYSMLAETTPIEQRGIVLIVLGFFYTLGELTVLLLAYIFMPSLVSGNWRAVLAWASFPAAIVFVITLVFVHESPRFLLIKDKPEQARDILIKMAIKNNKLDSSIENIDVNVFQKISDDLRVVESEEQGVIEGEDQIVQGFSSIKKLLRKQFILITSIVWIQWFASSMVFSGITFLLPLTLQDRHQDQDENQGSKYLYQQIPIDLRVITLSVLGELPTLMIASIIVNIKFFGRKNSLAMAYFLAGTFCLLVYILRDQGNTVTFFFFPIIQIFSLVIAGSKLSINLAFTINYEFTSEVYPTYMRASGIGVASSIGKIGSVIMPWLVIYLSQVQTYMPYLVFCGVSLLAFLMTLFLPFDTYKRELDKKV